MRTCGGSLFTLLSLPPPRSSPYCSNLSFSRPTCHGASAEIRPDRSAGAGATAASSHATATAAGSSAAAAAAVSAA